MATPLDGSLFPPAARSTALGPYDFRVRWAIIKAGQVVEFWARHRHAEGPIRAWFAVTTKARWANPAEIKQQFGSTVDFVGNQRVI